MQVEPLELSGLELSDYTTTATTTTTTTMGFVCQTESLRPKESDGTMLLLCNTIIGLRWRRKPRRRLARNGHKRRLFASNHRRPAQRSNGSAPKTRNATAPASLANKAPEQAQLSLTGRGRAGRP